MAEYNIEITDVLYEDTQTLRGFLVTIEPPVDLSPDAVNAAITRDTLNPEMPNTTNTDLETATIIGSTDTRTAIYVSLPSEEGGFDGYESDVMGEHRDDIGRGIKGLLKMLGIDDEMIIVQEAPETTKHFLLKY